MNSFERESHNVSGISGSSEAVQGQTEPEILWDRPTAWERPREVLRHGTTESILKGETALSDVLPGLGKSRTAAVAAKTGIPISVFTNLTENYGQFEDWCEEFGVHFETFPRTTEDCPTLRGDHPDDENAEAAQEAYFDKGWPVIDVHDEYDLPCQYDGTCSYMDKVRDLDFDGSGLFAGYYNQAYAKSYVDGRVVVLDEDPFDEYYEVIKYPAKSAQKFIDTVDDFPLNYLRPLNGQEELRDEVLSRLEQIGLEPSDHTDSVGDFHAKAPLIAYAIYGAEELDNGLNYTELPGNRFAVFKTLYKTDGDDYNEGIPTMWLFDPPDFSGAEAVIGLDATPCLSKWRRILGDDFKHYRLFTEDQRNQYLRERKYEFIQLNPYAWPAQGGNLSLPKCGAYLREVYRKHGERPDLITSKDVRDQLEDRDLDHLWSDDLYYDDFRGKNDLKDSELLVVLGSPSRPDSYYQHLTALFGESAERVEGTKGTNLSFGSPVADDILDSHRRGDVFQAIMRAGRNDNAEATVYIATGMVPDWLETKKAGRIRPDGTFDACRKTRQDSDRAVMAVLQDEDGISGREVARRADFPKSTTLDALNRLRDEGLVEKVGQGRGTKWHSRGIEGANIAGNVNLKRMAGMPLKNPLGGCRPFSEPVIPRREPPVGPSVRYPDWMRDVQRRAEWRKFDEQLKQRWRDTP